MKTIETRPLVGLQNLLVESFDTLTEGPNAAPVQPSEKPKWFNGYWKGETFQALTYGLSCVHKDADVSLSLQTVPLFFSLQSDGEILKVTHYRPESVFRDALHVLVAKYGARNANPLAQQVAQYVASGMESLTADLDVRIDSKDLKVEHIVGFIKAHTHPDIYGELR